VEILYNLEKPFSPDAYKKWNEFANPDYHEKYCHYSGEHSDGETSFSKPVLSKYWKKAQAINGK
jgi:hypothetical protein